VENPEEVFNTFRDESILNEERAKSIEGRLDYISDAIKKLEVAKKRITEAFKAEAMTLPEFRKEKTDIELSEEKLISERDALMMKHNVQHDVSAKIDLFKETCHKFLSKINDPKIVTERLKKDIIKLVIDEVVIEGESVKIFATIPLPNKIHEREMDPTSPRLRRAGKTDIPGPLRRSSSEASTFSTRGGSALGGNATNGATLGPVNETNMARIWNKHKQSNTPLKRKVFVAMSGGVDSSVAALLLQKEGYDLVGCYIKGWYPASSAGKPQAFYCSWKEDRRDAMRVCAKLGIPFITVNAEKEYKKEVVDYMISEYKAGRTPNPDIMCNKSVKFGVFLKKSLAMGADYIATGHYVRLRLKIKNKKPASSAGRSKIKNYEIAIARDTNKDQSYFLWTLTQEQLKYCLFPLGGLLKSEVRHIAKKNGLATAEKEESQGVCFIGEFDMEDFLKKYIKQKKGKVITAGGKIIGEHNGLAFYTIGQRHGFGFGGGEGGPYYIVEKDFKNNRLIVAEKKDEKSFSRKEVIIENANWISAVPKIGKKYQARIRYRQPLEECGIRMMDNESKIKNKSSGIIHNSKFVIKFYNPQRAVTPGQSLVVYDGKEMIGGGVIIKSRFSSRFFRWPFRSYRCNADIGKCPRTNK